MSAERRNAYELLFSVEVLHDYFATPSRLRLRFEPDAATQAWMTRTGCVARTVGHVLQVWFESKQNGPYRTLATSNAQFDLCFGVYAQDPQFTRFTEGLPTTDQPPLCFYGGEAVEADGVWTLGSQTLAWRWRGGARPDFVLALPMTAALAPRTDIPEAEYTPGRAYRARLKNRESYWKYVLLGDWKEPSIVDQGQTKITFEPLPETLLPDGRTVHAFRATSPIALEERLAPRFRLHATPVEPGIAPISRLLPVPAAANLARDRDKDGRDLLVSEIFVSR